MLFSHIQHTCFLTACQLPATRSLDASGSYGCSTISGRLECHRFWVKQRRAQIPSIRGSQATSSRLPPCRPRKLAEASFGQLFGHGRHWCLLGSNHFFSATYVKLMGVFGYCFFVPLGQWGWGLGPIEQSLGMSGLGPREQALDMMGTYCMSTLMCRHQVARQCLCSTSDVCWPCMTPTSSFVCECRFFLFRFSKACVGGLSGIDRSPTRLKAIVVLPSGWRFHVCGRFFF